MAREADPAAGEIPATPAAPLATEAGTGAKASRALEERLAGLGAAQRALLEERLHEGVRSGHQLVAESLAQLGITHVYGVPGQPTYDTAGACVRAGIRLIGTRHQHPAALMAAAHNYLAGRQVAATIVSSGAPAANAVTAALVANDNCWPLLILAGATPAGTVDTGYFMGVDTTGLYRPVTKWVGRVDKASEIPAVLARAHGVAASGRPGAVLVELPEDALTGMASVGESPTPRDAPPGREADSGALREVVAALVRAKRPLLVLGKGARWSAHPESLRELVDSLGIPFVTGPLARGMISDEHESCMNAVSWRTQSQADLILLLGTRLDWVWRYGELFSTGAAVIQVDVQAPESGSGHKVTLGVHADAGRFLRALLRDLDPDARSAARCSRDRAWIAELRQTRKQVLAKREAAACQDGARISPLRLAAEIRDALPADAISIFDGNLTMTACQQMIPALLPVARLTPGTSGCMGVGIPYAIAAKLAHPERPVVAICGDFATGLSVMEMETAVRHQVPVVIVVANNDGNGGTLRHKMHFPDTLREPVAMFQPGLRYDRIVEVLGGYGQHVERAADIGPALARAIASGRPACIDVALDPDAPFPRD